MLSRSAVSIVALLAVTASGSALAAPAKHATASATKAGASANTATTTAPATPTPAAAALPAHGHAAAVPATELKGRAHGRAAAHSPTAHATETPIATARTGKNCIKGNVVVQNGTEEDRFNLVKCDGSPAPLAVEHLSLLLRPGGVQKPTQTIAALAHTRGEQLSPGIRRIDARLIERLGKVVDHFGKAGHPAKVQIVSGYRPGSTGSYHAMARAMDFKVEGVHNEALVAFCKSIPDTGCGYYPNSLFVHMDVRDPGSGHVTWIDASGPGEKPRYVTSWPPPAAAAGAATDTHDHEAKGNTTNALPATPKPDLPALPANDSRPGAGADHDDADNAPAKPATAAPATPATPTAPASDNPYETAAQPKTPATPGHAAAPTTPAAPHRPMHARAPHKK